MAASMGSSLFAAMAFSGASYLFRLIDKNGYSEEIKRHNKAMEDLTRAREKWTTKYSRNPYVGFGLSVMVGYGLLPQPIINELEREYNVAMCFWEAENVSHLIQNTPVECYK